jgi:hypothetical protein
MQNRTAVQSNHSVSSPNRLRMVDEGVKSNYHVDIQGNLHRRKQVGSYVYFDHREAVFKYTILQFQRKQVRNFCT